MSGEPLNDELLGALADALDDGTERAGEYEATPHGFVRHYMRGGGDRAVPVAEPLSNFTARIVESVTRDDGAEARKYFTIEARMGARTGRVTIPPNRLGDPQSWALEALGHAAAVEVGQAKRDHVRRAVQAFSEHSATERTEYAHLGWRRLGDRWGYLHAGGAIGADGPIPDVCVRLSGALARFELPAPPEREALAECVRASLAILNVKAPDTVTVPLLAAVYRAVLPSPTSEAGVWLVGPSGSAKSSLAALAQAHHGATFDRLHLPLSWASTGNAIEGFLFAAAHALVVVDDFAPAGGASDVAKLHGTAERVIRGAGNGAGRNRMNADGTLRPERPPRAMILGTGEDVPRGHSIRARLIIVEAPPSGDEERRSLTGHQRAATDGRLAGALAGYVQWLARRWASTDLAAEVTAELAEARDRFTGEHGRTPEALGSLRTGWRWWLTFATDVGAVTAPEAEALLARVERALTAVGAAQGDHLSGTAPAARWLELLASAIASGKAHLADSGGNAPPEARRWGWRSWGDDGALRPEGARIGWVGPGGEVWLDPIAAYGAVRAMATASGDDFAIAERTLRKRLAEGGHLAEREAGRERLTVRRTVEGAVPRCSVCARALWCARNRPNRPNRPRTMTTTPSWDGRPSQRDSPNREPSQPETPRTLGRSPRWDGWDGRTALPPPPSVRVPPRGTVHGRGGVEPSHRTVPRGGSTAPGATRSGSTRSSAPPPCAVGASTPEAPSPPSRSVRGKEGGAVLPGTEDAKETAFYLVFLGRSSSAGDRPSSVCLPCVRFGAGPSHGPGAGRRSGRRTPTGAEGPSAGLVGHLAQENRAEFRNSRRQRAR